ncbi:copper-containing nitrite reductase [Azospirillum sp.]|uniref:copper-containing nitrite reductase n=1 Tax=Azospirillum sp. TaxID=34012 RepID=UPI003D70AC89
MTSFAKLLSTAAAVALIAGGAMLAQPARAEGAGAADIVRSAADLPAPLAKRAPQKITLNLETVELDGKLADGATYRYWTFKSTDETTPRVPGPFVRVRVGDTVDVKLHNHDSSAMNHNIDFHAVTGPGGGGVATVAEPGQTKGFTFQALNPGLYVYHCAVPMAAQHISNGMYGLILVEPEGGLPKVDREFYVMQGEIYTEQAYGASGELTESYDKLMNEQPEYFVFNGAANALQGDNALKAKVGETVRIYFGVGGPNKTSSFHVIGEIFDKLYAEGDMVSAPKRNVQTTMVPAGGATAVEFKLEVPGKYMLVDHSLSRAARGLVGILDVEGPENPAVFRPHQKPDKMAENHH